MEYRTLGRTGLQVSKIGLGTGGKSVMGQRQGMSETESHRIVHKALDLGINLFDTSPAYLNSEAILGRALRSARNTDKVVICTKVRPEHIDEGSEGKVVTASAGEITDSVERSLNLLGVEALDIVLLHAVLPGSYQAAIERVYPVVIKLKEQGKIRFVGISEQAVADPRHISVSQAAQADLVDVVMVRYTLVHQKSEQRVFPTTASKQIGVMAVCPVDPPLCRPVQLQEWIETLKADGKLGEEALSAQDPVRGWIEEGTEALTAASMRFAANQKAVDTVITGTVNPEHLESNVRAALGLPLPPETENVVRRIYGRLEEGRL